MDRREARLALELAEQWTREGLMPAASLAKVQARHSGEAAEDPQGESFGSGVLYGLGGVLLGAASFALIVLLDDNGLVNDMTTTAPWILLAWGLLCGAAAFALDLVAKKPRLGDALHVAALVAVTASGFPRAEDLPLGSLSIVYAAGTLWYRRDRFLVPFLALVAINVAVAGILFGNISRAADEEVAFSLWFGYALCQMPLLVLAARGTKWSWPTFSLSAATLLLAGTFLGWFFDVGSEYVTHFDGQAEVFLAILMGSALGAGLALREKGLVLASAFVIAIDAVVFAFDVGEIIGGLLAILSVAGLLIWQAGSLRRYLREA